MSVRYFAYGSNMNPRRLERRKISFAGFQHAILPDYRLLFDVRDEHSSDKGYANIEPLAGSFVEGTLYEIESSILARLDGFECEYRRHTVVVSTAGCSALDAITYIALSQWRRPGLRPPSWYVEHLLESELLSDGYAQSLRALETVDESEDESLDGLYGSG